MHRREFIEQVAAASTLVPAMSVTPAISAMDASAKKQKDKSVLIYDPIYLKHVTGPGHPERPDRLSATLAAFTKAGLDKKMTSLKPELAQDQDILRCHTADYLKKVKQDIASGADQLSTGDTSICPDSLDVARRAVGGIIGATDQVCSGKARNAFCLMRPPGHHATPARGMGFCIFNNAALAARYAQAKYKIEKVLIVDWDVHHGNGTQDIFYEDDSVFFFSTHQSPWYPGTGAKNETGTGKGQGSTLNIPLPAGSGRKEVLGAFQAQLAPAMQTFKPQLIIISAGFDSRIGDPLGKFTLTDQDFIDLTKFMMDLAKEHADSRIVSVLEGGYSLEGLASAATAHARTLIT